MSLLFEWDPIKAQNNALKHGVTFEEVTSVFGDPFAIIIDDPDHSSAGEQRSIILGESERRRILLVSHLHKSERQIRIISARKATPRERRRYEEGT